MIVGAEAFASNGLFFDEDAAVFHDENSLGGYVWSEYSWDPHWAAGVMVDVYQMAEQSDVGQKDYDAWVTWRISHFNHLRFQYRFNDVERSDHEGLENEDSHEFMLQWIIVIGSHQHGLDW